MWRSSTKEAHTHDSASTGKPMGIRHIPARVYAADAVCDAYGEEEKGGETLQILIACEESQAVCKEMRRLGHECYSCDIQECSGVHPEWHIMADVIPLLNGRCSFTTMDGAVHTIAGRWDMIIAHPPCTKTSNAGARHLYKGGKLNLARYYEGLCGKALFMTIWAADCDRVIIENPTPSKVFEFPEPSQSVQPHEYYGENHPYTKKTLLWERGVEPLVPVESVEPIATWCPSGSYSHKHGDKHRGMFTTDRAKNRSKTFPGIARAMAEQWAGQAKEEKP